MRKSKSKRRRRRRIKQEIKKFSSSKPNSQENRKVKHKEAKGWNSFFIEPAKQKDRQKASHLSCQSGNKSKLTSFRLLLGSVTQWHGKSCCTPRLTLTRKSPPNSQPFQWCPLRSSSEHLKLWSLSFDCLDGLFVSGLIEPTYRVVFVVDWFCPTLLSVSQKKLQDKLVEVNFF